jgi:hypothetical protein
MLLAQGWSQSSGISMLPAHVLFHLLCILFFISFRNFKIFDEGQRRGWKYPIKIAGYEFTGSIVIFNDIFS